MFFNLIHGFHSNIENFKGFPWWLAFTFISIRMYNICWLTWYKNIQTKALRKHLDPESVIGVLKNISCNFTVLLVIQNWSENIWSHLLSQLCWWWLLICLCWYHRLGIPIYHIFTLLRAANDQPWQNQGVAMALNLLAMAITFLLASSLSAFSLAVVRCLLTGFSGDGVFWNWLNICLTWNLGRNGERQRRSKANHLYLL